MSNPDCTFSRVGVVSKPDNRTAAREIRRLTELLASNGVEVLLDDAAAELAETSSGVPRDALAGRVDLLVVLGGDGTLLSVAQSAAAAGIPVLGINYGALGFLTSTAREELIEAMNEVLAGRCTVGDRQLLRATVSGPRRQEPAVYDVLNDAVLNKTDLARIVELSTWLDGDLVTALRGDGLIVCTATGSTAYSLAAGGPIVMPQVDAIVLTPICPHTLTNRPLVVPGDAVVEIRQESTGQRIILTLDGQLGVDLEPDDVVSVRRAPYTLQLVHPLPRSYFEVLRTKLRWGAR